MNRTESEAPGRKTSGDHSGQARMATSRVVICGLAHQCARTLPRTLQHLDQLRSMFLSAPVVVFENESRDRTLSLLKDWAERREEITILSRPFPEALQLPEEYARVGTPAFSMARIKRMAWARNQYLDHVRKLDAPDFLLVLDFDLHRVSLRGIVDTFGTDRDWDAVFSNSRSFSRYRLWQPRVYWDTYAFKPRDDHGPQTQDQIYGSQKLLQPLKPGDDWLPVASAFGGLGIYRWEAIRPFRYQCAENRGPDPVVRARCEHVTLHAEMASAGYGRLYINPAQIIYYDSALGKVLLGLRRIARRILVALGLKK